MKELVLKIFEAPRQEQEILRRQHSDAYMSDEYTALVSLNNVCQCRLQRRKCKHKYYTKVVGTPANIVHTKYYAESADDDAGIPTIEILQAEYIKALKLIGIVPTKLDDLYNNAINYAIGKGRPICTIKENMLRSMCACSLLALARVERKYNLGIFPIKKRCEARSIFFNTIDKTKRKKPNVDGSKDMFTAALHSDPTLQGKLNKCMEYLYRQGFFSTKNAREMAGKELPGPESMAWWCYNLLKSGVWNRW